MASGDTISGVVNIQKVRDDVLEDIVAQTDHATLWALVCMAETLITTNPYELYKYMRYR